MGTVYPFFFGHLIFANFTDRTEWQCLVEKLGETTGELDDSDESTTEAKDYTRIILGSLPSPCILGSLPSPCKPTANRLREVSRLAQNFTCARDVTRHLTVHVRDKFAT